MDIYEALQDKVVRVEAMKDNFPLFFAYHFWWEFKSFHIDWMESMQSDKNTFIEWFRASRKTTIAKGYIIRCICYKKRDYILRQSYEEPDSRSNVTDIAKMLFTPSIVEDYGKLFPLEAKMEDFSKKTQGNFDTTNKVRVQAKGLMQSTRWLNTFDSAKWQTERPDLLVCQPKWNIVLTDQWERLVEEIKVGDIVYSHDGTYNKVLSNWATEEKNIISIKIHWYNQNISMCEWHKVYAKNYLWSFQRRYERLTEADFYNIEDLKIWSYIWFPIDMTEKQYVRTVRSKKIESIIRWEWWRIVWWANYIEYDEKVTIPKWRYYILWQFAWDGSVTNKGIVIYCDNKKQYIIDRIKKYYDWNIAETIVWSVNRLTLSSSTLWKICKQIKQKKNSWKLLPFEFEQENIENQIMFMKWYIDSDWFVDHKNWCIRITSVCLPLLRQIQRILLRLGVTSSIRDWIDWQDWYMIWSYKCNTQKKYDLYMKNWTEILWYDIKSQTRYKYENLPVHISDWYLWSSIREIKEQSQDICYAFSVEEKKSYCGHLVAHHNCDDVDVVKSVMNPEIINQNERKLLWELLGALDPLDHKIIFLGNTILEDGIVPRLRRLYENNDWRDVFRQPLFVNNENVRPEVFTDEVIKDAQGNGKIAYQQNYLLTPASSGTGIFVREYFDYFLTSHFENVESPLQKQDIRRWIFIDPAFSTSNKSDDAVVIILWEHRISKQYYLLDWYGWTSAPSSTRSHIISMYHKATLWWYRIELIHCEDVKINKDQTKFIEDLRAELLENHISVPLYTSTPNKQKNQRIVDILEPVFSMKGIKFNRGLNDDFVQKLERQLLQHPNSDHDDHSDCLAQWIWYFRKAPEKKPTQRNLAISAITNRPIMQPTNRKSLQWVRWYSGISGRPL